MTLKEVLAQQGLLELQELQVLSSSLLFIYQTSCKFTVTLLHSVIYSFFSFKCDDRFKINPIWLTAFTGGFITKGLIGIYMGRDEFDEDEFKKQLAAALGVDPEDITITEIVESNGRLEVSFEVQVTTIFLTCCNQILL